MATPRVLLVVARYPWPARRGDQLRSAQWIDALSGRVELVLLSPHPPAGAPPAPARPGLAVEFYRKSATAAVPALVRHGIGGEPLQSAFFASPDLEARCQELLPRCDRAIVQLVRLAGLLPRLAGVPVGLDLIDSLALNFDRRARFDRAALRWLWRWEAARLRRAEESAIARSRTAWVVCERDRRLIAGEGAAVARLEVLRLPVALAPETPPGGRRSSTVVVSGNFGYFPNRDGLADLLSRVWPVVRARVPAARLLVAGARLPARWRGALRRVGASVIEDPGDLRAVIAGAGVAFAPLRAGSGVPVKVLEAWAAGVPVVASPFAAAGAGARDEEELLCADVAPEWAAALARLCSDDGTAQRVAQAGRLVLARRHAPEVVAQATWEAVLRLA